MRVIIEFDCDNDAFIGEDDPGNGDLFSFVTETRDIFARLEARLEEHRLELERDGLEAKISIIQDSNGNAIGSVALVKS